MPQDQTPASTPPSTNELAFSMMRLWGREARPMARNYALDCWRKGDAPAYMRWHCVEWRIEQVQAALLAYEGTVSGKQPERAESRRWFDRSLDAIRQLGSGAMRGTGL